MRSRAAAAPQAYPPPSTMRARCTSFLPIGSSRPRLAACRKPSGSPRASSALPMHPYLTDARPGPRSSAPCAAPCRRERGVPCGDRRRMSTMADPIRTAVVGPAISGASTPTTMRRTRAPCSSRWSIPTRRAPARSPEEFGAEPVPDHRQHHRPGRCGERGRADAAPLRRRAQRCSKPASMCWSRSRLRTASKRRMRSTGLAEERGRVLQGRPYRALLQRLSHARKMITDPLYFESYRIAPWKNRGVEVDVVLDLMIHDIDMIIGLVGSPVGASMRWARRCSATMSTSPMPASPSSRAASRT